MRSFKAVCIALAISLAWGGYIGPIYGDDPSSPAPAVITLDSDKNPDYTKRFCKEVPYTDGCAYYMQCKSCFQKVPGATAPGTCRDCTSCVDSTNKSNNYCEKYRKNR